MSKENEIRITGAVVFRGTIDVLNEIIFLAETKGQIVYQKVTSPDRKLWITEDEG